MSATDHWNDRYQQGKGFRPVTETEVALLAERLGPGAGRRVLDLGCAPRLGRPARDAGRQDSEGRSEQSGTPGAPRYVRARMTCCGNTA
ncbi:hypothetical protein ACFVUH_12495 [Kitasatospora sp. NPDC058032]|uniref:hypothetical protein n=1 Tax=Kitasatospora sp. NPDC058032 TaxID=3346307 RepID=UPI0036DAD4C1